jgi:hypothetical protein
VTFLGNEIRVHFIQVLDRLQMNLYVDLFYSAYGNYFSTIYNGIGVELHNESECMNHNLTDRFIVRIPTDRG